ncbi:MAG: hypothetical protein ACYCVY_13060 [Acidiferrobacteraceae bacterium]
MIRYDKATRTFRDSSGRFVSKSRGLKSSIGRKQYKHALPKAGRRLATKRVQRATSTRKRVSAPIRKQWHALPKAGRRLATKRVQRATSTRKRVSAPIPAKDYGQLYDEIFNQIFAPATPSLPPESPPYTIRRIRREEDFEDDDGDIEGSYYDSSYSIEDEFEYVSWDELFEQFDADFEEEVENSP